MGSLNWRWMGGPATLAEQRMEEAMKREEQLDRAFEKGAKARERGTLRTSNPYRIDLERRKAWREGYDHEF